MDCKTVSDEETKRKMSSVGGGSQQMGGAETTMASEYYGATSNSYFQMGESSLGQNMNATAMLVRPPLNASPGVGIPLTGGASNDTFQTPFGNINMLDKNVFADLIMQLQSKQKTQRMTMSSDVRAALQFIVDCNITILFGNIKKERKKYASKRGAPVSVSVVREAIRLSPFTIPT